MVFIKKIKPPPLGEWSELNFATYFFQIYCVKRSEHQGGYTSH